MTPVQSSGRTTSTDSHRALVSHRVSPLMLAASPSTRVADATGTPDRLNTRIAICGETYDDVLPLNQLGTGLGLGPHQSTGFIAVYDGTGSLLWSYQFYGDLTCATGDCAITDVSVRFDAINDADLVTYCGIST